MTAPLIPCDACSRHLRADETRCPFCGASHTPKHLAYAPIPRLSRAALAALGALTVVPATMALDRTEADAQPHGSMRPLYGLPPRPLPPEIQPPRRDAGAPRDAGTGLDAGAPIDAGTSRDAGAPRDAGTPDTGATDAGRSRAPRDAAHPHRPRPRPYPPEAIPVPLYGVALKPH